MAADPETADTVADPPQEDLETIELPSEDLPPAPRESESDDDVLDDDNELATVEEEINADMMDVQLVEMLLASSFGLTKDPDFGRTGDRVARAALQRLRDPTSNAAETRAVLGVISAIWDSRLSLEETKACASAAMAAMARHPEVSARGFQCCWKLSLLPHGQEIAAECGWVQTACAALESTEFGSVDERQLTHKEAATALWNVCAGHQANTAACTTGVFEALARIQSDLLSETGHEWAADLATATSGALWCLLHRDQPEPESCVAAAVRLLQHFGAKSGVVKPIVGLLGAACAASSKACTVALAAGVAQATVSRVQVEDQEDVVNCLQLYARVLASTKQHQAEQEGSHGLVAAAVPEQLVRIIHQHSQEDKVVSQALGCVQMLSQWEHLPALDPCLDLALQALKASHRDELLQLRACGVIRNLATHDSAVSNHSEIEIILDTVLACLCVANPELQGMALETLRALVYRKRALQECCVQGGALKHAVRMLSMEDVACVQSACKFLWNVCVNDEKESPTHNQALLELGVREGFTSAIKFLETQNLEKDVVAHEARLLVDNLTTLLEIK